MEVNERNDFRKTELKELYDYYFGESQDSKNVVQEIKKVVESRGDDYLHQKGLVEYKEQKVGGQVVFADARINANGIDLIELETEL